MRFLLATLVLCSTTPVVPGRQKQEAAATKPAGKSAAAQRLEELNAKLARLEKELATERDRMRAARTLQETRIKDLFAIVDEFPKSGEANEARIEIAARSMRNRDFAADGRKALEGFAAKDAKLETTLQAAWMAASLGMEDKKATWIDQALAKAASLDDKLQVAMYLKGNLNEEERGEKLYAELQRTAKNDEDRARILLEKANGIRMTDPSGAKKAEVEAILSEIVRLNPGTRAGRLAKGKLAAADLRVGGEPIPFAAKDLQGRPVSLDDYKGKVVLLDFWATWCGPCIAEVPNVLEAYGKYHEKGFDVLGISLDDDRAKLEQFIKEKNLPWRQVFDGKKWDTEPAQLYDVQNIPLTILVGKDGKIAAMNVRGRRLEEEVKAALGER